ncbi:MAG TPA: phosphoribosylanthranilate isomerase [Thermoanaerobaculia bacterium]|nr:phosphoribosylanthranilate isomerase [Thermoanaerobaculia bacterium]
MTPQIKICGITRYEDAAFCADLGADYLGFIFVPSSPRYIEPEQAAAIMERVQGPKFVGVFRDAPASDIVNVKGLHYAQLHGTETDDDVRAAGLPAIKALRVGEVLPDTTAHPSAAWLMFDTYGVTGGGTGRIFDWSLLALYPRTKPFFLAGGLTPDNVGAAISTVRPDAVDVSSGVESAPGVKDHAKIKTFFERVRRP